MDLSELLANIETRKDLASFVQALVQDLENDQDSWENDTLPRFLEALRAWLQDMEGYFKNKGQTVPEQPGWNLVGTMLLAAKYYE